MRITRSLGGIALGALIVVGGLAPTTRAAAASTAAPPPADFVAGVTNPWFPLKPGTTLLYAGTRNGKPALELFRVTSDTKLVAGVRCIVVMDTLLLSGRVAESTFDWYAQDKAGNVWYFGERTREYDAHGRMVSSAGSWEAGVNGARAGIFMPASPRTGQSFQQEYSKGVAEDHFAVESLTATITVPYGHFDNLLRTREWTPLEPGVLDAKYYVRGIGQVREVTVRGPRESLTLVQITHL